MTVKMDKVFCYKCLEDVDFVTHREERTGTIKSEKYPYMRIVARCIHCSEELDVYNDENLKILYDVYRESHDLISLEKIREIPEMFNVGKRVLSSLLGWGEHTFTRYYDGYIPTKHYSDVLKKLYDNPSQFRIVLEEGKQSLSEVAYRKSTLALQKLLVAEPTPIMNAAAYVRSKKNDLSSFRLQKLLYYIQGVSTAFMPSPLFYDLCEAWANGPVYREVYYKNRDNAIDESFSDLLSDDEKEIIDCVLECFGRYDGDTLVMFTHSETPWIEVRGDLPPDAPSDRAIPLELIRKFFVGVRERYSMMSVYDIRLYAQDMFKTVASAKNIAATRNT